MSGKSPAEALAESKSADLKGPRKAPKGRKVVLTCLVKFHRKQLDLSIREVADHIGVSVAGLHAIEQGCDTQLTTARKLCKFFAMKIDDLWPE